MKDISFIQQEVAKAVRLIKDHKPTDKGVNKYPEFYEGYNEIVKQYEDIRIHTVKGTFPAKLFEKRSPNMQDSEFEYVRENYKQTTLPIAVDYFNSIKRAFNDGNWSIDYGAENKEIGYKEYIENDLPIYGSLEEFVKQVLPVIKTQDPNGVIAVRPFDLPVDDEGNVRDDVELSPTVFYFSCKNKIAFKEREWYLVLSERKSTVIEYAKEKQDGLVFEFYDDTNVWMIKQVGKKSDYTFEAQIYYAHNLGSVPAQELKGIPVIENSKKHYQSPYIYASDILDLILLNSSRLQVSINSCVFPVRVMIGNECDFIDSASSSPCINGKIQIHGEGGMIEKICPSCSGTGMKARISPLGTILLRPKSHMLPDGEISAGEAFKFHSPDVSTLDFLIKKIDIDEAKARGILHIYNSNTNAQGADGETATGKYIDQKTLYSFIKPISDEMFSAYEFMLNTIGEMRYGERFDGVSLNYPNTFEFLTEQDYINQIKDAMDAGMPPMVVTPLIYRFLQTFFYNDDETAVAFELLIRADRLLTMTKEEVSLGLTRGSIAKWEEILHYSGHYLVVSLLRENENFMELEMEAKLDALIDKAKQVAEEVKAAQPIESTDPFAQLSQLGIE
jgi:hypothetical protein